METKWRLSLPNYRAAKGGIDPWRSALLGGTPVRVGSQRSADRTAVRQAPLKVEQERCQRRRGDLRGSQPAAHALPAGKVGGAAGRAVAVPGA